MPWTHETATDNLALSERTVLVTAHIRHGGDSVVVANNRDALTGKTDGPRATLWNLVHRADVHKWLWCGMATLIVLATLTGRRNDMQPEDGHHSCKQRKWEYGVAFRLKRTESHVGDDQGICEVDEHVQRLPHRG